MPSYQASQEGEGPSRRSFLGGMAAVGAGAAFTGPGQGRTGYKLIEYSNGDEEGYWSLEKCKRCYMDYLGSKTEEIDEQKVARQYRHGAQWTPGQVEIFNLRRQPVVTYNRIGRKIDSIVGLMEKIKQDPKAYPRNPRGTDEMGAELATACVRYVVESDLRESRFPFAIENGAVDGIGGVEMMLVKGDKNDTDVGFAGVKTDSFFYDPRCFDHDFSDARYMGTGKWLDMEDAIQLAPSKSVAKQIEDQSQSGSELTSQPDRERRWFDTDPTHKRVRVVDLWYKCEGEWRWCLFTGSLKIDEGKGYFFNEKNEMICKYIMFSAFVDHDGDRYGFPRGLKSSQDEVNQRRSKGLHELNSRRIKAEDGAFSDIEVTRREAVRPDGVVIYNKGFEMEFDDQARIANVEGQLKFLEDAKNEIENFGPNPALIGQGLEYKSGRAINLLQQAGIAELGPFVINVKNWKLRLYRAIWCAIQRYWTAERYIRVTDDEGIAQLVQINGVGLDEMGYPRLVNAVGQLDVNFTLDEGPDEVNMMGDSYDTLVALTAQGANIPPQILLELAPLQASLKRKLLALIEKPDPVKQQAQQITIAGEAAKVDETKSKTALNIATAQEKQQGGAHGIIERQLDAAGKVQEHQMKRDEHQMKMQESMVKVQGAREVAQIKGATEFEKMQTTRAKGQQDLAMGQAKNVMSLQAQRDKHVQQLKQQSQKATGKSPKGYAEGGRPAPGETAIVGENGPELFVPDVPGTIVPRRKTGSPYDPYIESHARRAGVDPALMRRIMQIESGGDPRNTTGSYRGLFQMSWPEFKKYGGQGDIYAPEPNVAAAANKIAAESKAFQARFGRAPTPTEIYMIHQQGEGGSAAHFARPNAPAWQNMYSTAEGQEKGAGWAKKAIWGNIPDALKARFGSVDNVTSKDFTDLWKAKVEGEELPTGGGTTAVAGASGAAARPRDQGIQLASLLSNAGGGSAGPAKSLDDLGPTFPRFTDKLGESILSGRY